MKRNSALLVFILLSIQQLVCYGQNLPDSAKVYRIETVDGNIYSGKIISEDLSVLVLKTTNLGELRIREMDEAGIDLQLLSHGAPSGQKLPEDIGHLIPELLFHFFLLFTSSA